jgi:DNA mismatch repair protein MutH
MKITSEKELLEIAKNLRGKSIKNILNGNKANFHKGSVGNIIEYEAFGVKPNNDARPDFPELGIELKVLPLKKKSRGEFDVKERTKICSINYVELVKEKWTYSHAKIKLNKILFIFYYHDSIDLLASTVIDYHLFHLELSEEPIIKADWHRTKKKVEAGLAHELSESENLILAASRSGQGGLSYDDWPKQPNITYQERARQRAFSLKPSFTRTIWLEVKSKKTLDTVLSRYQYNDYTEFEKLILSNLNQWRGYSISEFAKHYGVKIGNGKNSAASLLRTVLGIRNGSGPLREISQLGLTVKITPCRESDFLPYESMSFPFQPLGEFANEDRFDRSEFYTYLQGFLLIPLIRTDRKITSTSKIIFGNSFIWRPDKNDLLAIQKEWEKARQIIRDGIIVRKIPRKNKKGYITENNLLKESESEYIHMRPHARDSNDIDESIKDIKISKQSFWLNKKLIQKQVIRFNSKKT